MNNIGIILLMAGNGIRFGGVNKTLELINNKPIFLYSLEILSKISSRIYLVIRQEDKELIERYLINFTNSIIFINGGDSRKSSVFNALKEVKEENVLIHDAARPIIDLEIIKALISSAKDYDGITLGTKSKDTIKITDDFGIVKSTTLRNNTWNIQTPQCFKTSVLLNAHKQVEFDDNLTDDCVILERIGKKVKVFEGNEDNIKVTTLKDYNIVKSLIENKK